MLKSVINVQLLMNSVNIKTRKPAYPEVHSDKNIYKFRVINHEIQSFSIFMLYRRVTTGVHASRMIYDAFLRDVYGGGRLCKRSRCLGQLRI